MEDGSLRHREDFDSANGKSKIRTPIIVFNSNGTIIDDIIESNSSDLEELRLGIFDDLRNNKKKYFPEFLKLCDTVINSGAYQSTPVNEAAYLPQILGKHKITLFAAASEDYLKKAYEQNGLDKIVRQYISVFDDRLRGDNEIALKDKDTFRKVRNILNEDGYAPVAYVSHKQEEAELGAKVFGYGILIDPTFDITREETYEDADNIIRIKDLRDLKFLSFVEAIHKHSAVNNDATDMKERIRTSETITVTGGDAFYRLGFKAVDKYFNNRLSVIKNNKDNPGAYQEVYDTLLKAVIEEVTNIKKEYQLLENGASLSKRPSEEICFYCMPAPDNRTVLAAKYIGNPVIISGSQVICPIKMIIRNYPQNHEWNDKEFNIGYLMGESTPPLK